MNSDEFRYRPIKQSDFQFLQKLLTNQSIAKNFSKGKDYEQLEIHQILDLMVDFWAKYNFGIYVVSLGSNEIGIAGFKYITNFNSIELLYCLDEAFWGQGHASKIAKEMINIGLYQLQLPEIYGVALSDNIGSIKILNKIGLLPERTMTIGNKDYSVLKINNNRSCLNPTFDNIQEIDL